MDCSLWENMARVCGNQWGSEHCVLGDLRLRTAVCFVVLFSGALLALSAPSAASSSPPRPHPESLWKQYPLNTARSGPSGPTSTQNVPKNRPRPRSTAAHSSGGHDLMWWFAVAWGIFLVVALVWGIAFIRMLRRRRASQGPDGATGSAARPDDDVTAALREVLRAREEGAAPELAAEPRLKLKRVASSTDQVETLKQKAVRPSEKDVRKHEVSVLKAKLGASRRGAARDVEQACHIEWSPGGDASRFLAKARNADGSESIVSSSPPFKWEGPAAPPTSLPRAAKAYAVLVQELKNAGWMTTGRGEDWYSLELQRRPLAAVREGEA